MFISPGIAKAKDLTIYDLDSNELKIYEMDERSDNRYDVYDYKSKKHYDVEVDKEGRSGTVYDIKEGDVRPFLLDDDTVFDIESGDLYFIED